MTKKKIIITYGTRAELIKLSPLIKILKKNKSMNIILISIKQHDVLLTHNEKDLKIIPDKTVQINRSSKSINELTSEIIKNLEPIFINEKPDLVIVQGDTCSALASSLTAINLKILIAYVEAGLRYDNGNKNYIEDINRRLITQMATYFYVPTLKNKLNLIKENINEKNIIITGNTIIDSVKQNYSKNKSDLVKNKSDNKKYLLLTTHRRENIGKPQNEIFKSIKQLVMDYKNINVIYPVHPNPTIHKHAYDFFHNLDRVTLLDPIPYKSFLSIIDSVDCVLSDSGGIQEECESLKTPLILLRDSTERYEENLQYLIGSIGHDKDKIISLTTQTLDNKDLHKAKNKNFKCIYGDGIASHRIFLHIVNILLYNKLDPKEGVIEFRI